MARSVDVARFIDERKVGGFQLLVLVLCFIIMIIDGFDAQAIGSVAPIISVAWGVSKASFSPVFAAGLLGMALGALLFGALVDRFGRKAIIVVCFVTFGVLTIAKAYATSILAHHPPVPRRPRRRWCHAECNRADVGIFTGTASRVDANGGECRLLGRRQRALGIGRVGSLLSPVLGGMLLSWQWQVSSIFLAVAVPAFLAAVCVLLVGWFSSTRGGEMETELAPLSGVTSQASVAS
jgi:MFS family permease